MEDFKHMLASRTIWALIVGFLATLLTKSGYQIGEGDVAYLVDTALKVVEAGSYLLAAFFRVKATKVIGKPPAAE